MSLAAELLDPQGDHARCEGHSFDITISNNGAGPFTFDASTEPLIFDPMSLPGASLTWIGP